MQRLIPPCEVTEIAENCILLLAGSRYYLRGIETARQRGFKVAVADQNPDAPAGGVADVFLPIDISDHERILEASRELGVDAIIPLNDYGVLTAALVADALALPGIGPDVAKRSLYKDLMRQCWDEVGVPCPRFRLAHDEHEVRDAIMEIGFPCILKPARGIGGASRGVVVVRQSDEIESAITYCLGFYDDKLTLVEAFIDSELEHSAEVLINDGNPVVIAFADKVKTPLPYRVDKSVIYPTALEPERRREAETVVCNAVRALGIKLGSAHVEFATTSKGPILFELGARCGGGGTPDPIMPFVTGIEPLIETIRLHMGEPSVVQRSNVEKGCVYQFLTPPPGRLKSIRGLDEVKAMPGILDAEVLVEPGATVRQVQTGLDRAGFIIAGAETREEALLSAHRAENTLIFEYEDDHR